MAEEQRRLPAGDIHETAFYQADAELNKTVFRAIERHKVRVIWAGAGFGAGYEYYEAHLNFDKFKRTHT